MSTILSRNSWGFDNFYNFFQTKRANMNEIVLYVLSRILCQPIAVMLKDDVWNILVYQYLIDKTTTPFIEFFENEKNARSKVIKWLELCTKEDKNAMSTILSRNSWGFDNFYNFFQTKRANMNEIVMYVLSQIFCQPIAVMLKDDVWNMTVNYMLGETELLFVYGGENHIIPMERMTDSELEADIPVAKVKKGNLVQSILSVYVIVKDVVLDIVSKSHELWSMSCTLFCISFHI